jgi:hypothetical protein
MTGSGRSSPICGRDLVQLDSRDAERERYRLRYFRAQRRYIEEQSPRERATFVLHNTRLDEPELVRPG